MKCPQCGEPVSQFAAGCAVCGADLEAHRAQAATYFIACGAVSVALLIIPPLRLGLLNLIY